MKTVHDVANRAVHRGVDLTPDEQAQRDADEQMAEDEHQRERWARVGQEAARRLADCDCIVFKAAERGEPVAQDWRDYRDALRAIARQEDGDPDAVEWPERPD